MRWPWWRRRTRPTADAEAVAAAREAQAKLREWRVQQCEVRAAVDDFTAAVEAALRRRT